MNEVDAALNAWSVYVQLTVAAVMTIVFFALWKRAGRSSLKSWSLAWALDLVALVAVLVVVSGSGALPRKVELFLYLVYAASKVGFAAMLLLGLAEFHHSKVAMGDHASLRVSLGLTGLFVLALIIQPPVVAIQAAVSTTVALLMVAAGFSSLVSPRSGEPRILAFAFFIHSGFCAHHGLILSSHFFGATIPSYMSRVSFVDAGVELLLGVALLMALGNSALDEMKRINGNLEAAQRWLRELVDADPLTGLFNRRRLRSFITEVKSIGGILVYLDIDLFKSINDHWGHGVGDECLKRVADKLREVFRSEDGLFRMGGDEFLVVAPGLEVEDAKTRIETLRRLLSERMGGQPAVMISAGFSLFGVGPSFEEALASADHAMYRDKEARGSSRG